MPIIVSPPSSRPSSAHSRAASMSDASAGGRTNRSLGSESARDMLASPRQENASPLLPALISPRTRLVQRNLAATFEAMHLDMPEGVEFSDAGSTAPSSHRSDISVRSGVWQMVANQHDEELHYVQTHFGNVVRAMRDVIVSIDAIDAKPTPPRGDGTNTPLWREKVELCDPNFMERLLPLTVMRALVAEEPTREGAMQIFEAFADLPDQIFVGLKAVHLCTDLEKLTERRGRETTVQVLTRGLESRAWDPACLEDASFMNDARLAAHTLLEIVAEIPEMTRTALVRAAVNAFNNTSP